jgi:triacylglycerol esterase/lipase EstA (alpha/beta hydrolase family)
MRILLLICLLSLTCFAQNRLINVERGIPGTTFKVRAQAGVWYKTCSNSNHSNKITKPYIVCEGFDPDGTNDLLTLYSSMSGKELSFFDLLRADGWDIVIVNLLNNGEAIENNALLVEQLLIDIDNEVLTNHTTYGTYYHRPMLMGISMGGLICRYALAKMETQGDDHKVEKFISFDTPNKGANVPLAFQAFVNKFTGNLNFMNQFIPIINNI